ncbi:Uncharacterised protein [Mycobacteroides abscessus subsp. massiliense]|nr:Uncharacterised protein [Mycobacteroides abscessus]SHV87526.1 Uncharacterised protein [Mycobacteroides abscessus subsp. abscessus]SIB92572.1 Uncharacterised protein [Mycobacteroides abscessus subsp. bolletii]SLE45628.1 Uncharacterised protein [Mycobacteroides abscessus subsp. massiliense]CPS30325.1 Uncharacterised protein [Mycobacteroides abscessus]
MRTPLDFWRGCQPAIEAAGAIDRVKQLLKYADNPAYSI